MTARAPLLIFPPPRMDLTLQPTTDPTELYRTRDGLYAADLLITALVHLDLFTWLDAPGEAGVTEEMVAGHFGIVPRLRDVLFPLLKARGLVTADAAGHVRLTPLAREHCVAGSPFFLGPYYASLQDRQGALDLLHVLRTGQPVLWGGRQEKKDDWHVAMADADFAGRFTAAMDCRGRLLGQALARAVDFAGKKNVLDVAGGSGIYACALCAGHPHLQAAVLEKPPVDAIAARLVADRGFAERVSLIAGDMMDEPLPAGFDCHLWSNVLHDWDVPEVQRLVRASAEALPAGGLFIMHDVFLNDAKDGPLHAAEYSVTLAHATQGRCYSTAEMRAWLADAGFGKFAYTPTVAARGVLTAVRS